MVSNEDRGVGSMAAANFLIMDLDSADRCMHSSSLSMFNGFTMDGGTVEECPCFEMGSKAQSSCDSWMSVESFHRISSREKRISPVESSSSRRSKGKSKMVAESYSLLFFSSVNESQSPPEVETMEDDEDELEDDE